MPHLKASRWFVCLFVCLMVREFEFEWGFYALSASKAIFRARIYNCITYSVRWWWLLVEWNYRRKPTTGRQSPSLFDKWHGIFYMPSRIDEAGRTKAFDYPVAEHWGESRNVQLRGWNSIEPTTHRSGDKRTTNWATPVPPEDHITGTPGPQQGGGIFSQRGGGVVSKEQPRHEKAIPMGPMVRAPCGISRALPLGAAGSFNAGHYV